MTGSVAAPFGLDQASGLRRMFGASPQRWDLVLLPALRSALPADALALRARALAEFAAGTLLVDAARANVALALGMRLRYDLEHVLAGDCDTADACVAAGDALWVLPAARAMDLAFVDERHALRVAQAIDLLAADMRQITLVLPAARAGWIRNMAGPARFDQVLIPVSQGGEASTAVLTAVRQAMSEAQIDTFHLLFLGMGDAAAGRLLSGMAAIAKRHFGATLLAAPPLAGAGPAAARVHVARRSVEI
jgi:hypothetical protein